MDLEKHKERIKTFRLWRSMVKLNPKMYRIRYVAKNYLNLPVFFPYLEAFDYSETSVDVKRIGVNNHVETKTLTYGRCKKVWNTIDHMGVWEPK